MQPKKKASGLSGIRRLQPEDFHVSLVGLGVLACAVVSVWASTFVASLLYGQEPRDTATPAGSTMVLEAVGMLRVGWPLGALHGSTRQKY
jgi:hypothetical protein